MTLYITESGKIIDDRIIYGNSIEESIENLATHKYVGFIPDKPQELVRTNLLAAFMAERKESWIDIISYAKSGQVSWIYESEKYSIDATNCTCEQIYSKKYILLTFQEHQTDKNVLYDGKANFVFGYTIDENKIFTSEKDFYVVDDLHFVAYDRWQNKLVVLAGDNKLYVYDLNGNMISQVLHSDNLTIDTVRIDDVGYIRIMCNQISNISDNENVIQSVYNIQYSDYTLVKDLMFD